MADDAARAGAQWGQHVLLAVHQPIEADDFMPAGWCGGCDACLAYGSPGVVCEACSYSDDGPAAPVRWPCPVVCRHADLRARLDAALRAGTRRTLEIVAVDLARELWWITGESDFKPERRSAMSTHAIRAR